VTPDPRTGVKQLTRTPGEPLKPAVQRTYEAYFGADLSGVRVHADEPAAESARALGADAYTVGRHIAFGQGQYAPDSPAGRRLLAHELAHVAQQQAAEPDPTAVDSLPVASPGSAAERSAHQAANGQATAASIGTARSAIYRQATSPSQADPVNQATPGSKIKLDLGWLGLSGGGPQTNGQLVAIARFYMGQLESDLAEVESDGVKAQAQDWLQTIKDVLPYFDTHASEPIGAEMVPLINHEIDQLAAIRTAMQQDKDNQLREALRREHRAAESAADEAEAMQPKLDDAMRAAYRKGTTSSLKEAVSTTKSALSIGRNIRALAYGIATDIAGLDVPKGTVMTVDRWTSRIGSVKVTVVNVSKYTDMLATFGRGLTALNIALTVADRSKRATDAEQGMKDLNDVVGISTDLASLSPVSLPPHMSLYTTLWIKPALKVISKEIGVLVEELSEQNRVAVAVTGDLLYPGAEPGGQKMFDLMVAVMHADDVKGVPAISGDVADYFYEQREKLEVGAEEEVPTSGVLFWKKLDSDSARSWLFYHRRQVWAMLYGSMVVPRRPGR
jgi:hypothetical protein